MYPEVSRELFQKWKKMGYSVSYVETEDLNGISLKVYFRSLTKNEFEYLSDLDKRIEVKALGPFYSGHYQEIIETALLHPKVLPDILPASFDKLLAEAIVEASAWMSTDKLVTGLEEARSSASSLEGFLYSRIMAAFPALSIEQVKDLEFGKMINLVAMSELITGVPVDLQPWLDPEGYEKRLVMEQRRNKRMADPMVSENLKLMRDPAARARIMAAAEQSEMNLISSSGTFDLNKSIQEQRMGLE